MRPVNFHRVKKYLIALDGMPGSGKTSHIAELKLHFGNLIKYFPELHHPDGISDNAASNWYIRREQIRARVINKVKTDNIFVLDRGFVAVAAFMRANGQKSIIDRRFAKTYFYKPDITYFFDISPVFSLKRRQDCQNKQKYALWFNRKFLVKFRDSLKGLVGLYGKNIFIISSKNKFNKIQLKIEKTIEDFFKKSKLGPNLSVIICTRNRELSLKRLLKSLNKLVYPKIKFEVIVIDNGSDDHTKELVSNFKTNCWNLRYYFTSKLGLSHARNLGVKKSLGEIIAFLDDDTTVMPTWLDEISNFFQDRKVDGMGGKIQLVYPIPKPNWMKEDLELYLSKLDYPHYKFRIIPPQYIVGANMAFRRGVFKRIGYFLSNLGRKGNSLLSGEELEFCLRMMNKGFSVYFNGNAVVKHYITRDRLQKIFFVKRAWWQGITEKRLSRMYKRPKFSQTNWLKLSLLEMVCILIKKLAFKIGY